MSMESNRFVTSVTSGTTWDGSTSCNIGWSNPVVYYYWWPPPQSVDTKLLMDAMVRIAELEARIKALESKRRPAKRAKGSE